MFLLNVMLLCRCVPCVLVCVPMCSDCGLLGVLFFVKGGVFVCISSLCSDLVLSRGWHSEGFLRAEQLFCR